LAGTVVRVVTEEDLDTVEIEREGLLVRERLELEELELFLAASA